MSSRTERALAEKFHAYIEPAVEKRRAVETEADKKSSEREDLRSYRLRSFFNPLLALQKPGKVQGGTVRDSNERQK